MLTFGKANEKSIETDPIDSFIFCLLFVGRMSVALSAVCDF